MRVALIRVVIGALFLCILHTPAEAAADELCADYKQADSELNAAYQKVLTQRSGDKVFVASLKKAQRAWLAFRDAHIASIYPAADKAGEYGSMYGSCKCVTLAELTRQRTTQLQQWLSGMEGDVCAGSRI